MSKQETNAQTPDLPDFDAAARALGFKQFPDGRWYHPTPSVSMSTASTWDTVEQIFEWWGRANGNVSLVLEPVAWQYRYKRWAGEWSEWSTISDGWNGYRNPENEYRPLFASPDTSTDRTDLVAATITRCATIAHDYPTPDHQSEDYESGFIDASCFITDAILAMLRPDSSPERSPGAYLADGTKISPRAALHPFYDQPKDDSK